MGLDLLLGAIEFTLAILDCCDLRPESIIYIGSQRYPTLPISVPSVPVYLQHGSNEDLYLVLDHTSRGLNLVVYLHKAPSRSDKYCY